MNAKDIAYGYAIGYNDGIQNSGSGGGDTDTDPDYALWQALPEPASNQAIMLIRVTSIENEYNYICVYASHNNEVGENAWTVNWGDGTSDTMTSNYMSVYHNYTSVGDFILTFTYNNSANYAVKVLQDSSYAKLILAKYGSLTECETWVNSQPFQNAKYLKYLKLDKNQRLGDECFSNCKALKRIIYNGSFTAIYQAMFSNCFSLDFSNLDFSGVSYIDSYAFSSCHNLQTINVPRCSNVAAGAFFDCVKLHTISASKNCTFGTNAFQLCYSLYPRPDGSTD